MSRFALEREGPKVKVVVGAELSVGVVPELRELLCAIHEDGVTDLALDFSQTTFLDVSGIRLLLATCNTFHGSGNRVSLLNVPRNLFTILETLRLDQRLGAQMG